MLVFLYYVHNVPGFKVDVAFLSFNVVWDHNVLFLHNWFRNMMNVYKKSSSLLKNFNWNVRGSLKKHE